MILSKKKFFLRKTRFFDPKIGLFAHKLGPNGVHWGVYRVNFGFFEGPGPFGSRNNAKKILFEKKIAFFLAQKDLENFRAWPPPQNRPK